MWRTNLFPHKINVKKVSEPFVAACCTQEISVLRHNLSTNSLYLLYRHGCFTEKYTTCKIQKNYIRDSSGLFSIISHVSLSMISLISSLSLKLYLNSLVYHRNIFGSYSKVFGNLRQSSGIFGNFRKISENVRERSSGLRNNFGKSSEIFGRWSEIFGKSSKSPSSACLYNKKNITRRLEDMNFIFSWQKQYFTHSLRSFVKYCFATRK